MHRRKAFQASAPAATYLRNQNFETATTGYDNGETWTTSTGSPSPASTATVLLGTQSLSLNSTSTGTRVRSDFGDKDEVWVYFRLQIQGTSPGGDRRIMSISQNGGSTEAYSLFMTSGRALKLNSAGPNTTNVLSLNTTYHIWFHALRNLGTNIGYMEVGFSTDGTKPTSGNSWKELTGLSSTTLCGRIWLGCDQTNTASPYIFDSVLIDDVPIGSNP